MNKKRFLGGLMTVLISILIVSLTKVLMPAGPLQEFVGALFSAVGIAGAFSVVWSFW